MDIQQLFQQLFSVKTVLLSLGIGVIVYAIRLIVEKIPGVKKIKTTDKNGAHISYPNKFSEWWNDVILHLLPIAIGVAIGAFAKDFWPEVSPTRLGGIFYGAIAGWASGFVYRIAKKTLSGPNNSDELSIVKKDAEPTEPKEDVGPVEPKDNADESTEAKKP